MKKIRILSILLVIVIIFSSIVSLAFELPLRVVVNGKKVDFPDAQPFVDENSRTQVPARFVTEALGATVGWNGETKTVTVKRGEKTVEVSIDKNEMYINGEMKWQDTAPRLKDDRTFVPLRFVSEALGAKVEWSGEIRTAYIDLEENSNTTTTKPTEYEINGFDIKIGEKDDFYKNNLGGYSIEKDSKLLIVENEYKNEGDPQVSFEIQRKSVGANTSKQLEELKSILTQKLPSNTVNEIINYINPIINNLNGLDFKEINTEKYNILIFAGNDTNINILLGLN